MACVSPRHTHTLTTVLQGRVMLIVGDQAKVHPVHFMARGRGRGTGNPNQVSLVQCSNSLKLLGLQAASDV